MTGKICILVLISSSFSSFSSKLKLDYDAAAILNVYFLLKSNALGNYMGNGISVTVYAKLWLIIVSLSGSLLNGWIVK